MKRPEVALGAANVASVETIYPLISSSVAGPLGVAHLPRLWLKILLHASGRLPEGYRHGEGGFDELTCDNIGVDPAALVAFVKSERPDYLAFEAWVRQHARKLDPESIAAHNARLLSFQMNEDRAAAWCERFGLEDRSFRGAIALNNLDDWDGVYQQLTRSPATAN